jgi:hypothetical protein
MSSAHKIHAVPAGHRDRAAFEKLTELRLAVRGRDIPVSDILEGLTLKNMAELAGDTRPQPFTRIAPAINFLATLPDIYERLAAMVSLRVLFQLLPLPDEFSRVETRRVLSLWRYAGEVATLLRRTFLSGNSAAQFGDDVIRPDRGFASGWKMIIANDACPLCVETSRREWPAGQHPTAPLHIGCACTVLLGVPQS